MDRRDDHDGRIAGKPPRDIIDDEIYGWIETLNQNGVTAVFIFDSCFSGGVARVSSAEKKTLPAATIQTRPVREVSRSLRTDALPGNPSPVVILTASEANEPAQGLLTKGQYQGVFTTVLRSVLLAEDGAKIPPVKWGEALARVTSILKPNRNDVPLQTPRIFGNRDAPIFDAGAPFSNAVAARKVDADHAVIAAGADLGVTEGSIYKLFGPAQIPWRTSPAFEAMAKVVKARASEAEIETIDGTKLLSDALAAVEFEYAVPERKVKVRVPPDGAVDPFDRAAILAGLGRFAEIGDRDAELSLSQTKDRWQLATIGLKNVGPAIPSGDTDALRNELSLRFADYVRWKRLSDWKRTGDAPTNIRYRLQRQDAGGPVTVDGRDAKVSAGAKIQLTVENLSGRAIQADALLLRPNFTIDVCPLGVLEPKKELATELVDIGSQDGTASWKIVISNPAQQMSLLFLNSESGARSTVASLEDEFARVWNGVSARSRSPTSSESFWQTADLPFQVTAAQSAANTLPVKRCIGLPQK